MSWSPDGGGYIPAKNKLELAKLQLIKASELISSVSIIDDDATTMDALKEIIDDALADIETFKEQIDSQKEIIFEARGVLRV